MGHPAGPKIHRLETRESAYAYAHALLGEAVESGTDLEVQVQPWAGGWRIVVFDHSAAAEPQVVGR